MAVDLLKNNRFRVWRGTRPADRVSLTFEGFGAGATLRLGEYGSEALVTLRLNGRQAAKLIDVVDEYKDRMRRSRG